MQRRVELFEGFLHFVANEMGNTSKKGVTCDSNMLLNFSSTNNPNNEQSYMQLYFVDTDHKVQNRKNLQNLKENIIDQLIGILFVNPYSIFFRRLNDFKPSKYQLVIREYCGLDQRTYNAPTAS